jgi:uncharacterized protein YbjT (DUF2867 family)
VKVILFGASGMVGKGALRECLLDPEIAEVLAIGRSATGQQHAKLRELVRDDLFDLSDIAASLAGYDACFFCLGVSATGMKEAAYRRVTYDLTMAVARILAQQNPAMTFLYVSGTGTDSSERGRTMWARVKGKTENDLLRLPFAAAYMLRPGYIQPMHGIRSKTGWYQALYTVVAPTYPLWGALRQVRDHDGRFGPRHDQDRKTRRPQARARESGHKTRC